MYVCMYDNISICKFRLGSLIVLSSVLSSDSVDTSVQVCMYVCTSTCFLRIIFSFLYVYMYVCDECYIIHTGFCGCLCGGFFCHRIRFRSWSRLGHSYFLLGHIYIYCVCSLLGGYVGNNVDEAAQ
jgi:hypothetical protein